MIDDIPWNESTSATLGLWRGLCLGGDFGPGSNRHRPLRRRRGLAYARPASTLATVRVYLRDPWSAVLALRGMERGAMGHFRSVHALHLCVGKRPLDTLGRGEARWFDYEES